MFLIIVLNWYTLLSIRIHSDANININLKILLIHKARTIRSTFKLHLTDTITNGVKSLVQHYFMRNKIKYIHNARPVSECVTLFFP